MTNTGAHGGRLTSRREISPGLVVFRVAADRPFAFEPGQYAMLGRAGTDDTLGQRPVSIASSAEDVSEYEFFVHLVPGWDFVPLRAGDPLHILGPKGLFLLQDDGRTCVFVAGGTGLSPFMSMIRTLKARGQQRDIVLLHGVSRDADLAWRDELEELAAAPSSSLRYLPSVSRPQECPGWGGLTGRAENVLAGQLDRYGLGPENATIYACGHPEMIEAVAAMASAHGFQPNQVRRERYGASQKRS